MMPVLLISAVVLSLVCVLGWWRQCRTGNAGHADVIWSLGTGATALFYLAIGDGHILPRLLAAVLIGVWSARLGFHIHSRLHGREEDSRYRAMREALGTRINVFHFFFFQAQGALAWLFALPAWVIAGHDGAVVPLALVAGAAIGVFALFGEALADRQLQAFRDDPANRGKTCRLGLWRYSRHPNYFFEWMHWFSYPLLAWGATYAGWLWLAPLLMFLFLWFVTGVPYTERQAIKSRGDDYRRYQQETSMFFPMPPRRS